MKPLQHAKATEKRHGGTWSDYIDVHNLIDSSKLTLASTPHRALLHSELGVILAPRIFGQSLRNSDGTQIKVTDIVCEHIMEDVGRIPALDDWLAALPRDNAAKPSRRLAPTIRSFKEEPCLASSIHFGGHQSAYDPIISFFDTCSDLSNDPLALIFLHNTFGIWLAERTIGVAIETEIVPGQRKLVAVREVAELLVQARMNGYIPTPQTLFERMHVLPWMRGEQAAEAFRLKRYL